MKAIINKLRKWGTTLTLTRTKDMPPKFMRVQGKNRETTKRHRAKLKFMQEYLANTDHSFCVTTTYCMFHIFGL